MLTWFAERLKVYIAVAIAAAMAFLIVAALI